MRVCFFVATLNNSGGVERVTTVIASELSKRGYDIHIICWWGGNASFYPLDNSIKSYYLYDAASINIHTKYIPSLIKYRSLIRQIRPDVIIDVCVPLSLITIPVTVTSKIKRIAWEHFNVKVTWNFLTSKLSRRLASILSHKIVTLTNVDKNEYYKQFKSKNVCVIPNPVTIAVKERSSLVSKNVLAVGRLTYQKGFDLLLRSWQLVMSDEEHAEELKDWNLNIVGGGEDEDFLRNLSLELNLQSSVVFVKPTKQIESFYQNSSIFVMSSRFEGLPLALIEAKAFGLPTISFECETGPGEIITDGEDGVLVEPENCELMAKAIIQLVSDAKKRREFGYRSFEKAKKYKLDETLKSCDNLLKSLS